MSVSFLLKHGQEDVGLFDSFEVVPAEVANLLQRTKPHCASGPDGISAWMLRSFGDSLSPSIASMFNMCIHLGKLPTIWKVSHVVPVLPNTMSALIVQFPYPVLSIISKCLEGNIKQLLLEYLTLITGCSMIGLDFVPTNLL